MPDPYLGPGGIRELLKEVDERISENGPGWGVGHGLKDVNGNLTVNAVNDFNGDKTLPITAVGVETIVGNIEVLLGTI